MPDFSVASVFSAQTASADPGSVVERLAGGIVTFPPFKSSKPASPTGLDPDALLCDLTLPGQATAILSPLLGSMRFALDMISFTDWAGKVYRVTVAKRVDLSITFVHIDQRLLVSGVAFLSHIANLAFALKKDPRVPPKTVRILSVDATKVPVNYKGVWSQWKSEGIDAAYVPWDDLEQLGTSEPALRPDLLELTLQFDRNRLTAMPAANAALSLFQRERVAEILVSFTGFGTANERRQVLEGAGLRGFASRLHQEGTPENTSRELVTLLLDAKRLGDLLRWLAAQGDLPPGDGRFIAELREGYTFE